MAEAENRTALQAQAIITQARPYAPLLVIAVAVAVGFVYGLGLALLVLAGGMLLLAIAFIWESVQSLGDDSDLTLEEALALAAPSAEEERKRSVLRALKDLDYERGVGKVSEEDYHALSARYREEAKRLLQELDQEQTPARERAEKLVAEYLARKVTEPVPAPEDVPSPDSSPNSSSDDEPDSSDDESDSDSSSAESESDDEHEHEHDENVCGSCETVNDEDARFCKKCGGALT